MYFVACSFYAQAATHADVGMRKRKTANPDQPAKSQRDRLVTRKNAVQVAQGKLEVLALLLRITARQHLS